MPAGDKIKCDTIIFLSSSSRLYEIYVINGETKTKSLNYKIWISGNLTFQFEHQLRNNNGVNSKEGDLKGWSFLQIEPIPSTPL